MARFRELPKDLSVWRGKRVLVRVDWNVPLEGAVDAEGDLRIVRTLPLLRALREAGVIVLLLTHIGRPKGKDAALSTKHLVKRLAAHQLPVMHHAQDLDAAASRKELLAALDEAKPGRVHLLENVRFYAGEEKNALTFAKGLASLGEAFVQEAFSVCHRAHASVSGVAKLLPAYAGPALLEEVEQLSVFQQKKALKGFQVFFGGKKLSSKAPAIEALLSRVDEVFLGGGLALACERARGHETGRSFIEEGQQAFAKRLLKAKNVHLPLDYVVADTLDASAKTRVAAPNEIAPQEYMVDIGPKTLAEWAKYLKQAHGALWNGPVGISEIHPFGAGSRGLARYLAHLPKGDTVLVGGGDTIPVLAAAGVMDRISFVSTGGGAMLDMLVQGHSLPGLSVLLLKSL